MAEPLLASLANRLVNEDKVRLADGSPAAGSQGLSGEKQLALLIAVSVKPPGLFKSYGSGDEAEEDRVKFWDDYLHTYSHI